jgi:hypothetical protein
LSRHAEPTASNKQSKAWQRTPRHIPGQTSFMHHGLEELRKLAGERTDGACEQISLIREHGYKHVHVTLLPCSTSSSVIYTYAYACQRTSDTARLPRCDQLRYGRIVTLTCKSKQKTFTMCIRPFLFFPFQHPLRVLLDNFVYLLATWICDQGSSQTCRCWT